jgi:predicted 3-demethylubiquinone-9 3-methyltransferase (glyoxalase superfamily)
MTDQQLVTCLWFDDQAEPAAQYYAGVFPDSKIGRTTHYSWSGDRPVGSVLTVEFELNGQKFVGLNGGPQFTFNEAVSFQIPCSDQEEVDYYWAKLTEGGEPGPCGWLKDRYGVSWQVVPTVLLDMASDPDREKAARVMSVMMSMSKLDIDALRAAYDGG